MKKFEYFKIDKIENVRLIRGELYIESIVNSCLLHRVAYFGVEDGKYHTFGGQRQGALIGKLFTPKKVTVKIPEHAKKLGSK